MLLPQTAEYALRAILFIAAHANEGPARANAMAATVGAPVNYLAKTLHFLARAGILASTRGPNGGFRLAAPADVLSIHDVVAPFIPQGERRCLMGLGTCGHNPDCPVHARWLPVAEQVDAFLRHTTIADLLQSGSTAPMLDDVRRPGAAAAPAHA